MWCICSCGVAVCVACGGGASRVAGRRGSAAPWLPPHHPTCSLARSPRVPSAAHPVGSGDPPVLKICDFGFAKTWSEEANMFTQIG